jgi:hypothetical protein
MLWRAQIEGHCILLGSTIDAESYVKKTRTLSSPNFGMLAIGHEKVTLRDWFVRGQINPEPMGRFMPIRQPSFIPCYNCIRVYMQPLHPSRGNSIVLYLTQSPPSPVTYSVVYHQPRADRVLHREG